MVLKLREKKVTNYVSILLYLTISLTISIYLSTGTNPPSVQMYVAGLRGQSKDLVDRVTRYVSTYYINSFN
jgi:hypothetical protein